MSNPIRARVGAIAVALATALGCAVPAAAETANGPPERLIVKIREGQGPSPAQAALDRAAVLSLLTQAAANHGVSLTELHTLATGGHVFEVSGTHGVLDGLIASVRYDARIEYIEEDKLLQPNFTPNDSRYNEQWHYYEATAGLNLPPAWDENTGIGAHVAVLDTGYRPHADLAGNLLTGYDMIADTFVSNDGDGRDSDATDPGDWATQNQCYSGSPTTNSSWHGTHTSGTVAALTNNSTGVAGVGYNVKVVPVRVLGRCGGYISDISDGIIWASGGTVSGVPANANPAHVINMSLAGTGSCSSTLQSAINSARSRNAAVVVSAGNSNADAANTNPANCSGVITVAAVNRSGGRAYYSNYGAVVDFAAPGGSQSYTEDPNGVLSTYNTGTTTPGSDSYSFRQGTSMAAPHVAGAAALMYAKNMASTPDQIESVLKSTARAFPATCTSCGAGIVDASAAVNAISIPPPPPPSACPVGYTEYTGSISSGLSVYKPSKSGYVSSVSGTHAGMLSGPAGTNFDLYLQQKSSVNKWRAVASALGSTSTESISYSGKSGTYRWRIRAKTGSGTYTLCEKHP